MSSKHKFKMSELIAGIEKAIPHHNIIAPSISKSSVGWHIEHSLLTINLIIEAVKKSDSLKYRWRFNVKRLLVFTINKIPRGKAKAPKVVTPEKYDIESLNMHIKKAKERLNDLSKLDAGNFFLHPYFGNLNLKHTIKFLEIHTNHHLKIIDDILKSQNQ